MTRKHPGAVPPFKQPEGRGPNGRPFCRWCWGEVSPRRSSWCGPECVDEYRQLYDWNYARWKVLQRDAGVCAACGRDTLWLWCVVRALCPARPWSAASRRSLCWRLLGRDDYNMDPWEADHIVARNDGGTNELENLRTLCVPCHRANSARQQARWAERRCDSRATLFCGGAA